MSLSNSPSCRQNSISNFFSPNFTIFLCFSVSEAYLSPGYAGNSFSREAPPASPWLPPLAPLRCCRAGWGKKPFQCLGLGQDSFLLDVPGTLPQGFIWELCLWAQFFPNRRAEHPHHYRNSVNPSAVVFLRKYFWRNPIWSISWALEVICPVYKIKLKKG